MNITDDDQIIAKLEARDESALADIMGLYGSKCRRTAQRILGSEADAQEVLNDALLSLWNAIPPAKPNDLGAYLSTTVRNITLHRLEKEQAQKRTGEREAYSLDEENAPQPADPQDIDRLVDEGLLRTAVNRFLATLSEDACTIFVARYGSGRIVAEMLEQFVYNGKGHFADYGAEICDRVSPAENGGYPYNASLLVTFPQNGANTKNIREAFIELDGDSKLRYLEIDYDPLLPQKTVDKLTALMNEQFALYIDKLYGDTVESHDEIESSFFTVDGKAYVSFCAAVHLKDSMAENPPKHTVVSLLIGEDDPAK